jgi:hypothetical protein
VPIHFIDTIRPGRILGAIIQALVIFVDVVEDKREVRIGQAETHGPDWGLLYFGRVQADAIVVS